MTMTPKDRHVPAGEFKATCLALFDEVQEQRLTLIVTKRGRPVARIVPLSSDEPGSLRGSVLHEHDLISPVGAKWNVRL
jgi:prevent-host-death family protein